MSARPSTAPASPRSWVEHRTSAPPDASQGEPTPAGGVLTASSLCWGNGVDTSDWIGLGLQLIGTVVTAVALLLDVLDKPDLEPPTRSQRWPERQNPWGVPASRVIDGAGYDRWLESMRRAGGSMRNVQGPGAAIEEGFEIYRKAAGEDWRRQVAVDEQIMAEQLRLFRDQHERTRRRVTVEFVGLLVVAVGTIVSSVG